jgi:uncharacterized protein YcbK (DUF882 family)
MDSKHFHLSEMTCPDGTPYPDEWVATRWPALARTLEAIREGEGGHPIKILCGYRTQAYNERLRLRGLRGERHATGVTQHSQHMEGRAADIMCFGMSAHALHAVVMELWEMGKLPELGGVGLYEGLGFVHIDTYRLATGKLRRWNG